MKKKIKEERVEDKGKFILEISVFICGAIVMIFELTGSRILAPHLGTSIYVWTSLIGIILGCLSIGYWYGGKLADKRANYQTLSLIVLLSGILLGVTTLVKESIIIFVVNKLFSAAVGLNWSLLIVVIVLFAFPSILLGMVSPYAVKLKIKNVTSSGRTVGNLYAISTLGSITGTFLAGFVLIPKFGSTKILFLLCLTAIFVSMILYIKKLMLAKVVFLLLSAVLLFSFRSSDRVLDFDTQYNRVLIYNTMDRETNRKIRVMQIGFSEHSGMFLDNKTELVYEFSKYYSLAEHFFPNFKSSLMLGGAAYSYPKYYLKKYPHASLDVVEIDPKLTELAKKYFGLRNNPNLKIFHEDGRIFLNKTKKKYDIYMCDAFNSSFSIPYHLTTIETAKKVYDVLADNGVAIINVISAIEGERGELLRAIYATYREIFPQILLFPSTNVEDGDALQNIMMIALKSEEKPIFESEDSELNKYLQNLWTKNIVTDIPILTDDHAPVDHYISKLIRNM